MNKAKLNKQKLFVAILLLLEEENEEELAILTLLRKKKTKKPDELFTHRSSEGAYKITVERRLFGNEAKFREYFRVSRELFSTILNFIRCDIQNLAYNRRKQPISPEEKLCITLRYMATGEYFRSLAFQYRIHHSWISLFVRDVLRSIRTRMIGTYIPEPTEKQMQDAAQDYYNLWQYPNCCAAIDGKHIRIRCPDNAGSLFFNYKNYHSIVLFASVDARYRFISIGVGSYGREGDSSIFAKSNFGKKINNGNFCFPPSCTLPNTNITQPYVIIGDEAFGLTTHVMKPYPQELARNDKSKAIYNYRHCRARRTSENAFGIQCQYFRIFYKPIDIKRETADDLIVSACILHNMLRNSNIPFPNEKARSEIVMPKENMIPLSNTSARRGAYLATEVRDKFKDYFNSKEGDVPWQDNIVERIT